MKYMCTICGYIYDDAKEKVPFAQLPDDWKCPMCGAPKSAFVPIVDNTSEYKEDNSIPDTVEYDDDMQNLTAGQMAVLFSNLARGCEKQYKTEESQLFMKISKYFASVAPKVDNASIDSLLDMINVDINEKYGSVNSVAKSEQDRGAQRICVWGEKVTRMLSALLERYKNEGDAMLANTQIWICSVCGFVYIGDNPPEICPVCKVTSWKFKKIQGRQA